MSSQQELRLFNERTVFIVGAGASVPYGFPTGNALRHDICNEFQSQYEASIETRSISDYDKNRFLKKCTEFIDCFCKSRRSTIDIFLTENHQFKNIGTEAILFRLLTCETNLKDGSFQPKDSEDWYQYLFEKIAWLFPYPDDFNKHNDINIITFNYERSFEFLFHQMMKYSFTNRDTADLLRSIRKIKIVHMNGQIGKLDWQTNNMREELPFGWDPTDVSITQYSDMIRVLIDERQHPDHPLAHDLIKNAERIFFLGFGFSPENIDALQLMQLLENKENKPTIYATGIQLNGSTFREVSEMLKKISKLCVIEKNMDARALLHEYL